MSDTGSFWARRRAAVKAEEDAEALATLQAERKEALEGKDDAEILTELGLPDPSTLAPGDDFSRFMSDQVPDHLRRIALRTLWRSNPVLACVDGLNEYDDDYRAAMLLSEPVKTAYQVGKGMKAHVDEMQRKLDAVSEGPETEEVVAMPEEVADPEATTDDAKPAHPDETLVVVEQGGSLGIAEVSAEDAEEIPVPRRMRFRFEETVG